MEPAMTSPRISRLRSLPAALALACCSVFAPLTQAEDLLQIFNLAADNDPEIRQARAQFKAQHTLVDQGRSLLMPNISLTGRTSRDTTGIDGTPPASGGLFRLPQHDFANGFNTKGYGLNLRQALFNAEAWYAFQSARKGDEVAVLNLARAEQQLIIRVATAYFDVLRSKANLASFEAEEAAALQVLEQTQQRFDVGLIPITDVYDSQASADLANVNRLVEENNFRQRLEVLESITGRPFEDVAMLLETFPIAAHETPMEEWVEIALQTNPTVRSAELDFDAKKDDAKSARARMLPTLDLAVNYNWNQSGNPLSFTPNLASESSQVTLNVTVPLYTGGLNNSRLRQAYYTRDASEEALLKAKRDNTLSTRNAWRSVETDVRAVQARARAIVSAESALEATQVGAEVGTRNVVDVVLAQRLLFQAQRDYANARFNYVINTLTLKQSAGTLSPQDVLDLNAWMRE
jgi:outer membrane protein